MKPKYTPGPWFVEHDTDTIRYGTQTGDGLNPNSNEVSVFSGEEGIANAHLIAAAPELLEALKELFQLCEENKWPLPTITSTYIKAKLAIAKAEGEEK